jgi:hypothetical protein
MIAYFIELPHYFETPELPQGLRPKIHFIADHRAEPAIPNRLTKFRQFLFQALGNQLHSAVCQVSHQARDLKPGRLTLRLVPESHPLNSSGVENVNSATLHLEPKRTNWPGHRFPEGNTTTQNRPAT